LRVGVGVRFRVRVRVKGLALGQGCSGMIRVRDVQWNLLRVMLTVRVAVLTLGVPGKG
jgi:hypothetical protein